MNFLFGSDPKMKAFNPQALSSLMQLLQSGGLLNNPLYGEGSNYLQNILSNAPGAFEAFEAPYLQQFNQQVVPGIAERFAGLGTGGSALSSSGLNQSLARAGENLSTNLAGLRSGLQMQALPQALQYAQQPVQNQFAAATSIPNQYYEKPGSEGLLGGLLSAFGTAGGSALGGPFGAAIGSGLGNGIGSFFGGSSQRANPNIMQMARGTF